jgi:hypothetical protein
MCEQKSQLIETKLELYWNAINPLFRIQQRVLKFYRGRKLVLTRMVIPFEMRVIFYFNFGR